MGLISSENHTNSSLHTTFCREKKILFSLICIMVVNCRNTTVQGEGILHGNTVIENEKHKNINPKILKLREGPPPPH
jgi:hypothetical protein